MYFLAVTPAAADAGRVEIAVAATGGFPLAGTGALIDTTPEVFPLIGASVMVGLRFAGVLRVGAFGGWETVVQHQQWSAAGLAGGYLAARWGRTIRYGIHAAVGGIWGRDPWERVGRGVAWELRTGPAFALSRRLELFFDATVLGGRTIDVRTDERPNRWNWDYRSLGYLPLFGALFGPMTVGVRGYL